MKLEPKDSIRSIEYLCQLFPDKTAKEILDIREHDKKCHELWLHKGQEKVRAFEKKINDAGALYYKGRFGLDQRYFYKVYNANVDEQGNIYASVDSMVCFLGESRGVCEGRIHIELREDRYKDLDKFSLNNEKLTTKEEYEEMLSYLRGVSKFWEKYEEDKF